MNHRPTLIICVSTHHFNTQRVAQAIAEVIHASVMPPEKVDLNALEQYDLIGFGSGIYFGSHARSVIEFVNRMPNPPRKVFLFSTAGTPFLWRLFHSRLRKSVLSRGCEIVGEFNCRGWDTIGPLVWFGGLNRHHPDQKDLERASEFAKTLLEQC